MENTLFSKGGKFCSTVDSPYPGANSSKNADVSLAHKDPMARGSGSCGDSELLEQKDGYRCNKLKLWIRTESSK